MKKLNYKIRLLFILSMMLPGVLIAQSPALKSNTTSQGGGVSTQIGISHFGVAGQQVIGTTAGGVNKLNAGFIYTIGNQCPRPYNLTVAGITNVGVNDNTANLTWATSGFQNSAEIRYKVEGTIPWTTVTTTGTSYQLTGLLDGVNYVVQVRTACGGTFFSGYSELVSFITPGPAACEIPGLITTTSVSESSQTVTWPTTGAATYDVRYRLKDNLVWTFVTGLTTPSTTLVGLASGTTYQVQVRSVCSNVLQSVYSDFVEFTTVGASLCDVPAALTVSSTDATSAVLNWSHAGALSYQVRYRLKSAAIWTALTTTAKTITLTDLDPGMAYVYTVRATCNDVTGLLSPISGLAEFSTTGLPACDVPSNFTATASANAAALKWNTTNGALLYDLRYRVEGTSAWSTLRTPYDLLTLTDLSPGTSYQVQARSVCNADASLTSVYSTTFSFKTSGIITCTTPVALQATPATNGAVLTWAQQTGAFGYEVRYKLEGTTAWNYITAATNTVTVSALESGMPYMWTVRTICDQAKTLASPYAEIAYFETVGMVACEVPTAIAVSNITDQAATVSWTNAGAASYQIRYRLSGTTIWTLTTSSTPTVTLSGLESGMPYQVQVKAICNQDGSLQSLFSDLVTFETIGQVSCEVPTNLSANSITTSSATISWVVASGAFEYQVRYRVKGTTLWNTVTAGTNQLSLSGLEPGMTYQFSVRSNCSVDPAIASVFSVPAEFTTSGLPSCEIPVGFSVNAGDTDAEISWTSTGAQSYEARYRVSGSTTWINFTAASNTVNLGSLYSNTEYQFQVRSVCLVDGSLKSVYSELVFFKTTGTVSCETPVGLTISSITNISALVQWSAAVGANQYDIRYRVKGTTLWNQVLSASQEVILNGLTSGMPYQVRIRTICSTDNSFVSPYSEIQEFVTTGPVACAVPVNLQTTAVNTTTATVTWSVSNGAIGYEILYRRKGDLIWNSLTSSTASISITGLSAGSSYEWKVRTQCADDKSLMSLYSDVSGFATAADANANGSGRSSKGGQEAETSSDKESIEMQIVIYPNPFSERVNVNVTPVHTEVYQLTIFNMVGQKVADMFNGELKAGIEEHFSWEPHDHPSGIYVFKMIGKNGKEINHKIILAH